MSILLDRIVLELVRSLVSSGRLALVEGAEPEALAEELRARMAEAPPFSQAGAVLGHAIEQSPLVEELYASDAEIIEALNGIGG